MDSAYYQNPWALSIVLLALVFLGAEVLIRRKFSLSILARVLWIGLVGWILAEMIFVQSVQWSQGDAVKVFVDRSDSVAEVPQRKEKVEAFLKELQAWSTLKKVPVHLSSFAEHPIDEKDSIQWGGLKTLLSPLEDGAKSHDGVAILISDGLWTDYAKFKTPTFTIGLRGENEKDLWFERVQPTLTAFLKNRLKIPVVIGQEGFSGKNIRVSLWISGERLAENEVKLKERLTPVEFTYFPERMGEQIAVIKIEPMDGEISRINNEVPFKIRTVRDKIRLLHINGKPSQDLRAWRLFLTRQPDVDLVSFYILRTLDDNPEATNDELSLIPFPYDELFSAELEKFDVVILQNFDFNLYFPPFYLTNLARFVRNGGALLMLGGDQSFHRYQNSPLETLFPFTYNGSGELEEVSSGLEVRVNHPLISGLESDLILPTWTAHHKIAEKKTATTLLRFKSGEPFLSIQDVEKGRVAAVNSDELWKLQMQPTTQAPSFSKMGRRLLQYLTFDPEMSPQGIVSGPWRVNQEVSIHLMGSEKTNWTIRSLAFRDFEASFKNESKVVFKVPFPGAFQVKASTLSEARTFLTEEQPWLIEWRNLLGNDSKLKNMAEDSGGKFFDYEERHQVFAQPLSGRQMVSAQISSWSHHSRVWSWIILLLAIFLMGADFFLRKKSFWDV
jgi:hypothetical protein